MIFKIFLNTNKIWPNIMRDAVYKNHEDLKQL